MAVSPEVPQSFAGTTRIRSTEQVLENHLGSFAHGIDAVLADYDDGSVLITPERTFRGIAEIRRFFGAFLQGTTPEFWAAFALNTKRVEGDVAYITWASVPVIALATDTLVVRDGIIVTQTFTSFAG